MANWEYAFEVRGVRSNVAAHVLLGEGRVSINTIIDYGFIDQLIRIKTMIEGTTVELSLRT